MSEQKCPVCQIALLFGGSAEAGLPMSECGRCRGFWIAAESYWKWLEIAPKKLPPGEAAPSVRGPDTGPAKQCPDCGNFLEHHRVGHGLRFYLDHCGYCGGFWFDAGEWETLRTKGLHRQVHKIFSHAWQADLACEDRAEAHEQMLKSKLGEADFNEAMRIKAWIGGHKYRAELYAILAPQ